MEDWPQLIMVQVAQYFNLKFKRKRSQHHPQQNDRNKNGNAHTGDLYSLTGQVICQTKRTKHSSHDSDYK